MKIVDMLLTNPHARPRRTITPKGLVIHWTANENPGADAEANRNYFNSGVYASTQYIVDDKEIVRCIPEEEMAYHVGAQRYTDRALEELGTYPNAHTIGIEMCVNSDGDFSKVYQTTVELAADILKRYDWGVDRLWRHYDVTGKNCPAYFVQDAYAREYLGTTAAEAWETFKKDVEAAMNGQNQTKPAYGGTFKDVPDDHYAKASTERLAEEGIMLGIGDGLFGFGRPITREDAAVIVDRAIIYLEQKISRN